MKINDIDLFFIETGDTLSLKEIVKEREYIYTSSELQKILRKNKHLKVTVTIMDLETGKSEVHDYTLKRKKHTYPTGTFPHQ